MAMTAEHYQQAGLALLPLGRAWSRALDGQLGRLMLGLGDELARIDAVGDRLLNEMFANNAFMLLPDWEELRVSLIVRRMMTLPLIIVGWHWRPS